MKHEPFENKKERLAELLAKNKRRLARNGARQCYQQELDYQLTVEQFLDSDISQHLLAEIYHKVRTLQKKSQVFTDFQEVFKILDGLKQQKRSLDEVRVVFYYLYAQKTGGIGIKFKEFWTLLDSIGENPQTDIIVVDKSLAFGICIEVEEYNYLLTVWGFDNEDDLYM